MRVERFVRNLVSGARLACLTSCNLTGVRRCLFFPRRLRSPRRIPFGTPSSMQAPHHTAFSDAGSSEEKGHSEEKKRRNISSLSLGLSEIWVVDDLIPKRGRVRMNSSKVGWTTVGSTWFCHHHERLGTHRVRFRQQHHGIGDS